MQMEAELGGLCDAARPDAGCTHTYVLSYSVDYRVDSLKVWVPPAAARIVRVADDVPKMRPLAANCAFLCHDNSSQPRLKINGVSSLADYITRRTGFVPITPTKRITRKSSPEPVRLHFAL
jgi:hypothetical protein